MPVASSANCRALSNIIKFSCDVFLGEVEKILWPGATAILRKILPGYMVISWLGVRLVSSISKIKLPLNAALSTAIRIQTIRLLKSAGMHLSLTIDADSGQNHFINVSGSVVGIALSWKIRSASVLKQFEEDQ